jgi:hypothetical protein
MKTVEQMEEEILAEMAEDPAKLLTHIADLIDEGRVDQWASDQLRDMAADWEKGRYKK